MKKKQIIGWIATIAISLVLIVVLAGGFQKKVQGPTQLGINYTDSTPVVISTKGSGNLVRWQDGKLITTGIIALGKDNRPLPGPVWLARQQMEVVDSTGKPFKGEYISVNTVGKAGQ